MPDPLLLVVFVAGAVTSLAASWLLVTRLERIGAGVGLSGGTFGDARGTRG